MQTDFLDELGELALGSRLKRFSEKMLLDTSLIYKQFGIDLQPKWFTLLALLHEHKTVSVVVAAESLGLSQPAISQFAAQLAAKKLIHFIPCKQDSRRRLLSLTDTGVQQVAKMQPLWEAVQHAAQQLCTELDNDFYASLVKCERALKHKSLLQRVEEAKNAAKY